MKMKKTVLLLFFVVLIFALCGCNSETNNIIMPEESSEHIQSSYGTPDVESSNVSVDNIIDYDNYISPGEPYSEGIYITSVYYSEWLNLYCRFPLEMRPDKETIETIEEYNQTYGEQGSFIEMMAVSSDKQVNIYVDAIADNETFEQFIKDHYKKLRDGYKEVSVNGMQLSDSGDNFSTYIFGGEEYLLNTYRMEVCYNSGLKRLTDCWDLFRKKGDYVIFIQFMSFQDGVELEDFMSMFTSYEDHFNYSTTSNCVDGHTWETDEVTIQLFDGVTQEQFTWYHCDCCFESFSSLEGYYIHFDTNHTEERYREQYTITIVTDRDFINGYRCSGCGTIMRYF